MRCRSLILTIAALSAVSAATAFYASACDNRPYNDFKRILAALPDEMDVVVDPGSETVTVGGIVPSVCMVEFSLTDVSGRIHAVMGGEGRTVKFMVD